LELHRPSIKGTKLFLKVIKAIIIIKRYFALVEGATFKSVIRDERYARVGGEESQMLQDPYHRAQAHRPSKWWLYTKLMHLEVCLRVWNFWWGIRNLIGWWLRQWLCAEFFVTLFHGTTICLELIWSWGSVIAHSSNVLLSHTKSTSIQYGTQTQLFVLDAASGDNTVTIVRKDPAQERVLGWVRSDEIFEGCSTKCFL